MMQPIELLTKEDNRIGFASIAPFVGNPPEVIIWGVRVFRLIKHNPDGNYADNPPAYRETFAITLAATTRLREEA